MGTSILENAAISSAITDLEVKRKYIFNQKILGYICVASGVALLFITASMLPMGVALIVAAVPLITGIVFLVRIEKKVGEYKLGFKQQIIGAALSQIDQSLTISPNQGIYVDEFVQSQLFTNGVDRYHTEDFVSGKADKTSFYFAEVHAEYKTTTQTKNGTQTHWHTILKGILFCADFNKNFNGVTVIRPQNIGTKIGAWFSKNVFSFGDKNVVELENDTFNKKFICYSSDQVEARYILTPVLMERICQLDDQTSQTVSLSFIHSRLYIAFPLVRNYFEPPIYKSLLTSDSLENDFGLIRFMYNIVRELDLNTRIWTKR